MRALGPSLLHSFHPRRTAAFTPCAPQTTPPFSPSTREPVRRQPGCTVSTHFQRGQYAALSLSAHPLPLPSFHPPFSPLPLPCPQPIRADRRAARSLVWACLRASPVAAASGERAEGPPCLIWAGLGFGLPVGWSAGRWRKSLQSLASPPPSPHPRLSSPS